MKLLREETDLFYRLMWELQFYTNHRRRILADIDSVAGYANLSMNAKVKVRDSLWENPGLIDAYVKKNPNGLHAEELDIVSKWKRFVSGTFYIYRCLKKHNIFIGENSKVYGVLALHDNLEKMFYGQRLPIMVQTVLLPFKGKIIYDGILRGYNITFGSGIRSTLKEEYMAAKQNGRIITTLESELGKPKGEIRKPGTDWRLAVDELVDMTKKMKGGPAIQSSAFTLLRGSANLAQAAVHKPDNLDELWHLERRVRTALTRLQTTLGRAER